MPNIDYDPENDQSPITITPDAGNSIQITDPTAVQDFIAISKDNEGNPDLAQIQDYLMNNYELDLGVEFGITTPQQPGQPKANGGEEFDMEAGQAPATTGTVAPGEAPVGPDENLELAIDLQSVQSTDNIIKEIINMNTKQGKFFTKKTKKHQKVVDKYQEYLTSDNFVTEMALMMENDQDSSTSLKHNKIVKPIDNGFKQDINPDDEANNTMDLKKYADYSDDEIAPRVDADTISRPLDADNNYMNTGIDNYSVPVNDAIDGDDKADTANTGSVVGDYGSANEKKTLDATGWNKANMEGISREEYNFLMEEIDENDDGKADDDNDDEGETSEEEPKWNFQKKKGTSKKKSGGE